MRCVIPSFPITNYRNNAFTVHNSWDCLFDSWGDFQLCIVLGRTIFIIFTTQLLYTTINMYSKDEMKIIIKVVCSQSLRLVYYSIANSKIVSFEVAVPRYIVLLYTVIFYTCMSAKVKL